MKKPLLFLFFTITTFLLQAQTYNIATNSGTNVTCSGTFVDSGNGGNYGDNENHVITFCPTTPGDLVQIDFTSFDVEDGFDFLEYWQGNSNAGAFDTQFTGVLAPFTIVSTSPDGCLTFQFTSDFSFTYSGWSANISCVTPCTVPTAAMVDTSTVDICSPDALNPGSLTVAFDASNSTAAAGQVITAYEWNFGDGTTATTATPTTTHTYPADDEIYIAFVAVRDDNTVQDPLGCKSTNSVTRIIRVLPDPDFSGSSTTVNVACGASANLTGSISSQIETQAVPIFNSPTVSLPDGTGVAYTSTLDFTGFFANGDTVTPGCYPTLTFDIEHSATQDLEITLIAPTGESVVVFDREGPGGLFDPPVGFGTCVNGNDDGAPGCSATYTVVNAGGIAWNSAAAQTAATSGCPGYAGPCDPTIGWAFVPTTYNSSNPFTSLNGADLNGVWTIEIIDHEINDDGILDTWSLSFPPNCYSLETVTPDLTTANWTHTGTGPAVPAQTTTITPVVDPAGSDTCPNPGTCTGTVLSNDITVGPFPTPGSFTYTLTVVDEFGCEFEHDVVVVASCSCILTLDVPGSNTQTVCEDEAITDITYTVGGDATGATVSGLPPGVTGNYSGGTFTISGTPTTAVGSPFNYTVTTVGCTPNLMLTGTITVSAKVDPTFTQVAAICEGDALAALPTTSNNGI
ncbi:MAG: PKD domain-containing protein, partial [Oceanihabitans sp.]